MTVRQVSNGELFSVRIYKRLTNRPDRVWANTYEIEAIGAQENGPGALANLGTLLVGFEQNFHLPQVQFDRVVISTWVEDGEPYQPDSFISNPVVDRFGQRSAGASDPQPLQMCLLARFVPLWGRNGHRMYRGVLVENDVTSPGGDAALVPGAQTQLNALLAGNVSLVIGAPDEVGAPITPSLDAAGFRIVMIGRVAGAIDVRPVQRIQAEGARIKKYNNRYFDRGGSAPTPGPTP